MEGLSKEFTEQLNKYKSSLNLPFYLRTGEKLNDISQISEQINLGKFFTEDIWGMYLDVCLKNLNDSTNTYFDYNIDRFMFDIYFPQGDKLLPDGGAWIKVRTKNGFEVHFAKKSNRKKRWGELIERELRKTNRSLNKRDDEKAKVSLTNLDELMIRSGISLRPYEVYIYKTKTSKTFLYTNEYEVVQDIEIYSKAYMDSIAGVYVKKFYSSVNNDAVFYLQSRGISKKTAQVMAALKQMYFIVDMGEALMAYNTQWQKIFGKSDT